MRTAAELRSTGHFLALRVALALLGGMAQVHAGTIGPALGGQAADADTVPANGSSATGRYQSEGSTAPGHAFAVVPPLPAPPSTDGDDLDDQAWAEPPVLADPLESINRKLFDFNLWLYDEILEPAYSFYITEVPEDPRRMLGNLIDTMRQPFNVLNSVAAGEWGLSQDYLYRFGINATFGLLGTLDVASELEVPRHDTFGGDRLLCGHGVPTGPFLVLPFFGPTHARGAAGRLSDITLAAWTIGDIYPAYVAATNLERYGRLRSARAAVAGALDPYIAGRAALAQLADDCGHPR